MSNAVSALQGKAYDGIARIAEAGLRGMIAVRGDLSTTVLKSAATGIAAVDFPDTGECNCVEESGIAWMSPDEILVMTPYAEAASATRRIAKALEKRHSLVANVSDARAVFFIQGPRSREVMAKLVPVDLSPDRFTPGQFRRTRMAQVPAAFWMRDDETFELICFRSVAGYVFDLLSNAAKPGSEVGAF